MNRNLQWDPDEWSDEVRIHAILLFLAWGFFIPVAIFTSSHLNHRTWKLQHFGVHFHMVVATIGLILALAGFGYGIKHFSTLGKNKRDNVPAYNKAHAVIGTIATAGGILQLLLMAIMRPPKYEGESYTTWPWWQKVGHFAHRGLGFLWFFMGLAALEMGTHMTSVHRAGYEDLAKQDEKYSAGFVACLLATALTVAATVRIAIACSPSAQVTDANDVEFDETEEKDPDPSTMSA
jgi:hypothetical protein